MNFLRGFIPLLAVVLLGVLGCGVQSGRFVTTGSRSNALSSNVGCIDIIVGRETKPADENGISNEQNLLYLLIVTPGVQEHGSSSSNDYGKYVTTLKHSWNTDKGTFSVSIPWNRQTDTVTIGSRVFVRENGNVFVVRVNDNGEAVGRQLASLGAHSNFEKILDRIHQQLPTDNLLSSLKLSK